MTGALVRLTVAVLCTVMATRYFSFRRPDGTLTGLVRAVDDVDWAYVGDGEWVEKTDVARHYYDGDIDFDEVDEATAAGLAEKYGVTLSGALTAAATPEHKGEIKRLINDEGLTKEQATTLAIETQFDIPIGHDGKPIPIGPPDPVI